MLKLIPVDGHNVWDILKLSVREDQKEFVAPNDISLIEAYVAITHNAYAFPFGIYDGETLIGFLMVGFGVDDSWDDAPAVAQDNYSLWRLMIDKRYQGRGYGRTAMRLALDFIKTLPCIKKRKILCYASGNPITDCFFFCRIFRNKQSRIPVIKCLQFYL